MVWRSGDDGAEVGGGSVRSYGRGGYERTWESDDWRTGGSMDWESRGRGTGGGEGQIGRSGDLGIEQRSARSRYNGVRKDFFSVPR